MDWDIYQEFLCDSNEESESETENVTESKAAYDNDDIDGRNTNGLKIQTVTSHENLDDNNTNEYQDEDLNKYNAHGVIRVRLYRAINLPCPVGSNVSAIVSLPPYNGKIKSSSVISRIGTGVSVEWEREHSQENEYRGYDDECINGLNGSVDTIGDDNDNNLLSMVNGYSGSTSPLPTIKIDLTFSPLGMGIFYFTMASVELSTVTLLKNPGVWRRRWCNMKIDNILLSSGDNNFSENTLVRIQAVFEPTLRTSRYMESDIPKYFIVPLLSDNVRKKRSI